MRAENRGRNMRAKRRIMQPVEADPAKAYLQELDAISAAIARTANVAFRGWLEGLRVRLAQRARGE